jgi:hypothetical protein
VPERRDVVAEVVALDYAEREHRLGIISDTNQVAIDVSQ